MTATEKPNLTLYGIETQLLELLNFRESIESDPDMTPQEQQESLKACDESILAYVRAEIQKADNIAGVLREFDKRIEIEDEEIARHKERKRRFETNRGDLTNMVVGIMQSMGKTRIDGRRNILNLRKNPPSVDPNIQINLVPEELLRRTVTMTEQVYQTILNGPMGTLLLTGTAKDCEPMKAEISKRLKEGDGVPGCRLRTDGVRLEVK